uniref:DNA-directed RNA polymerase III subunit RPC4 n=2 Tax=Fagus sylvatica TaxID=28930 RepID=A0A2N9GEL2_FAGSY
MASEPLNDTTAAPRKMRFAPKPPRRRVPKPEVKTEVVEDADANQARELLRRFNEGTIRAKPKVEKKVAPVQVSFGAGGASPSIRYGVPRAGNTNDLNQGSTSKSSTLASGLSEKEYREPWDYYNYYPVSLPMRRPYSGNPELLNEEEFGGDSETTIYEENSTNPAEDLGLMEENQEASMFFLQLPPTVPMIKRAPTANDQKVTDSSRPPGGAHTVKKACALNELPEGFMGKMLVYRSGAIKLKLGDTFYDVSPGLDRVFSQDVVAINTAAKHCCVVGELSKHASVTPNLDSILDSIDDL